MESKTSFPIFEFHVKYIKGDQEQFVSLAQS